MIIWPFIARFEDDRLAAYVPRAPDGTALGQSGVTVAMGIDLGQEHVGGYLSRMLHDPALMARLLPYLGLNGAAAVAALAAQPLTLTPAERDRLNALAQGEHAAALAKHYNAASASLLTTGGWNGLSDAEQTVIASVAWQYGTPWARCPRFWGRATAQDWHGVIAELRDFGDDFPTRRNAEADLLAEALAAPSAAAQ